MKKLRFEVISKTFDCNKIKEIQEYVNKLCEKDMKTKTAAIAAKVGKKFECSVSAKYNPTSDYVEIECS